ncbi:hypothetical protein FA95DRAFT_1566777 [Auriscalpium vulgare]|uniref:Uncharacterized protein n=1 Tax=Auriscalpium vulgare TaxID=40419 RepID=A0ACB8R782_9AGAM|nr:hypothetical protein FA95DRAFT_1566777 [Auriscalpium vulgare]
MAISAASVSDVHRARVPLARFRPFESSRYIEPRISFLDAAEDRGYQATPPPRHRIGQRGRAGALPP